MLIQALIIFGLVTIPFLLIPGYDTREPKMALALTVALAAGLVAIYQGKLRPFRNKWILIFLAYLLLSIRFAPTLITAKVPNLWSWKPAFEMLTFALLVMTVAGLKLETLRLWARSGPEGPWSMLGEPARVMSGTMAFTTTHFSQFALFGEAKYPIYLPLVVR